MKIDSTLAMLKCRSGTYNIEYKDNSLYWVSSDGLNAIWIDENNDLVIGNLLDIGTNKCSIYATNNAKCPHTAENNWKIFDYNDEQWTNSEQCIEVQCNQGNSKPSGDLKYFRLFVDLIAKK